MKKLAAVVLATFILLVIGLSSAGSRTTMTEVCSSPAPTPTSKADHRHDAGV